MKKELDLLDRRLISLLSDDGRISSRVLAERLNVTQPTVNARIKNLIRAGVLRIAGLINTFRADNFITVIVAIQVEDDKQLDEKLEQISQLDEVLCAYVVTGRYDIFVEVVLTQGMDELYQFMSSTLPALGGIRHSESFVVMRARKKWNLMPKKASGWDLS
jgi:Lrp/AsnC family transcriptional regulator, regulator for asnA, asnC and gidA